MRYFLAEQASGPARSSLHDAVDPGLDLRPVIASVSPPHYTNSGTGTGIVWTAAGSSDRYCAPILNTKILDLSGQDEGTIELVVDIKGAVALATRLFHIGPEQLWGFSVGADEVGRVLFNWNSHGGAGVRWDADLFFAGRTVLTMVLDTKASTRPRLYRDGTERDISQIDPGFSLNSGENIMLDPTGHICIGNRELGDTSQRSPEGTISYAALYGVALTEEEIRTNTEQLREWDDAGRP